MGRYRKIDPRIWNDAKFSSLSHEDQRAFLFILTHPNMTSIGALRSSVDGLGAELGREPEEFRKAFHELLAKGLVKVDQKACLIWAPNFLKYNLPENPNVVKGWLSALDFVPECPLLLEIFEKARQCADSMFGKPGKGSKPYDNPLKSVCERLSKEFAEGARKSLAIQEQEQEQEHIKRKGGSNSSSLARVRETTPPELFDMPVGEADPDLAEAAAQTKRASTKKRGTQIPYDTLPDDWAAEAERIAPDLDARLCFEDFRDFALRDGAVYKDWTAAWRNNLRSMPEWKRVNFQKSKSYADLSHRVTRLPKDQRAQIWNEPDEAKQLALLEAFENGQNQL